MILMCYSMSKPSIILLITDGMGPSHMEAARIVEHGGHRPSAYQYFDELRPLSTQNYENNLTDSAAAATALSTGRKSSNGAVGVDERGVMLQNFVEYLREKHPEYTSGVISKVYSVHATPAGFLAHGPSRKDFSQLWQSVLDYSKADLIFGAGYSADQLQPFAEKFKAQGWNVITPIEYGADNLIIEKTPLPVIGAFTRLPQLEWFIDQEDNTSKTQPNLRYLVDQAIAKLSANGPFFLMVEASLVDIASHLNNATQFIGEQIESDLLMRHLLEKVKTMKDLQVISVADHETGGISIIDELVNITQSNLPIPGENDSLSVANAKRRARIAKLEIQFSAIDHTNSMVLMTAAGSMFGSKTTNFMRCTADVRKLLQLIVDGNTDIRPFEGVQKNDERQWEGRPWRVTKPNVPEVVGEQINSWIWAVFGVVSGLLVVGVVYGVILYVRKHKSGKKPRLAGKFQMVEKSEPLIQAM